MLDRLRVPPISYTEPMGARWRRLGMHVEPPPSPFVSVPFAAVLGSLRDPLISYTEAMGARRRRQDR